MGSNPFSVLDGQVLAALQDHAGLTAVIPATHIQTTDRGIDVRRMMETGDLQPVIWIAPAGNQPFEPNTGTSEKIRLDFEILILVPGADHGDLRLIQFLVVRALKNLENYTDAAGTALSRPFPYRLHLWKLQGFTNPLPGAPPDRAITLADLSVWISGEDDAVQNDYELVGPDDLTADIDLSDGSRIDLDWSDNSTGEDGYEIHRQVGGGGFSLLIAKAAGATSHTDTGLDPETIYDYKVRATLGAEASAFGNTATQATGAKPVAVSATISASTNLVTVTTDIQLSNRVGLNASLWISCKKPGPDKLIGDVSAPDGDRSAGGTTILMPHVAGGGHFCGDNDVRQTAADPRLLEAFLRYPMDAIDLAPGQITIVA